MKSDVGESDKKNIIAPSSALKAGDIVSCIIIFAVAAGLILFIRSGLGEGGIRYAEMSVTDGEETFVYLYPLNKDRIFDFESLGYHFKAEISDGRISITESGCPDGICRSTPSISSEREAIICVPAEMIIKIISDSGNGGSSSGEEDYDYVAH